MTVISEYTEIRIRWNNIRLEEFLGNRCGIGSFRIFAVILKINKNGRSYTLVFVCMYIYIENTRYKQGRGHVMLSTWEANLTRTNQNDLVLNC